MSEETAPAEAPAAPRRSRTALFGVMGGAAVLGVGAGLFLVGPRFTAAAPPPADSAVSEAAHAAAPGEKPRLVRLDNLILNPAGSQGMRFLMVSVALEVAGEKAESQLREKEVELRDAIISSLGTMTLDLLSSPVGRDSVRQRILQAALPMLKPAAPMRVFLPQFVIQ